MPSLGDPVGPFRAREKQYRLSHARFAPRKHHVEFGTRICHISIIKLEVVRRFDGLYHRQLQKNNPISPKETSTVDSHFSVNGSRRGQVGVFFREIFSMDFFEAVRTCCTRYEESPGSDDEKYVFFYSSSFSSLADRAEETAI